MINPILYEGGGAHSSKLDLVRPFKNDIWMFQKVQKIIPSDLYGYLMGLVVSRDLNIIKNNWKIIFS